MLNLMHSPLEEKVSNLLSIVTTWAQARPEVSAAALAGSHAHGNARPESDIELVILSDSPDELRTTHWIGVFGEYSGVDTEQWGIAPCHRVLDTPQGEVEIGIVPSSWADVRVDAGTYNVVHDGIIAAHDPRGLLRTLLAEVLGSKNQSGYSVPFQADKNYSNRYDNPTRHTARRTRHRRGSCLVLEDYICRSIPSSLA